jgi:hypothetical protein
MVIAKQANSRLREKTVLRPVQSPDVQALGTFVAVVASGSFCRGWGYACPAAPGGRSA